MKHPLENHPPLVPLLAGIIMLLGAVSIFAADYRELFQQVKSSVYLIQVLDQNRVPTASGTGFSIDKRGLVVTNFHVIEEASYLVLYDSEGKGYSNVSILKGDPEKDIALLRIEDIETAPLKLGSTNDIVEGAPIVVIGNPKAIHLVISEGIVSTARFPDKAGLFGITADISPGSSGSPVMTGEGTVIGIATGEFQGGQNLNFAVRIDELIALIGAADTRVSDESVITRSGGEPDEPPISISPDPNPAPVVRGDPGREWADPDLVDPLQRISAGDYEGSIEAIDRGQTLGRADGYLFHFLEGIAGSRTGRHDEAIAAFMRSISRKPDFAEGYYNLGVEYLAKDDHVRARDAFEAAIALRADYSGALSNLAVCQARSGDREPALVSLRKAIRIAPNDPEFWFNLGSIATDRSEVIAAFEKATTLDPGFGRAWAELGEAQLEENRPGEAAISLKRAWDLHVRTDEVGTFLALSLRGSGQEAVAEKMKGELPAISVPAVLKVSQAAIRNERYELALEMLEAIAIDDRSAEVNAALGFAASRLGDKEKAVQYYQKFTEQSPGNAEAWLGLFQALRANGEKEKAEGAREQYLKLR